MGILESLHLKSEEPAESSYWMKQIKYTLIVAVPLYGVIILVTVLQELGYPDYLLNTITVAGIAIDIAAIVSFHAYKYWEAAKYVHFAAYIRFDDNTTRRNVDLWIPPEGIRIDPDNPKVGKNEYRCLIGPIREPIIYNHPEYGLISFNRMFWDTRKNFEDEFALRSSGEAYFDEIPVTPTQSEGVALHIYDWEEFEGEYIPYAKVADSSRGMEQTLDAMRYTRDLDVDSNPGGKKNKDAQKVLKDIGLSSPVEHLLWAVNYYKGRFTRSQIETKRLDEQNRDLMSEGPTIERLVKDRQKKSYDLDKEITAPDTPLGWRILNAKYLGIGILVAIAVMMAWFLFGGG